MNVIPPPRTHSLRSAFRSAFLGDVALSALQALRNAVWLPAVQGSGATLASRDPDPQLRA